MSKSLDVLLGHTAAKDLSSNLQIIWISTMKIRIAIWKLSILLNTLSNTVHERKQPIEPSPQKSIHENHVYDFQSNDILINLLESKVQNASNVQIIGLFAGPYCGERFEFISTLADHMNLDHEIQNCYLEVIDYAKCCF